MSSVTEEKEVNETKKKKKRPLVKFRLRKDAGPHYIGNPDFDPEEPVDDEDNPRDIELLAGQTCMSRRSLDILFPNKFIRLGEPDVRSTSGGGEDISPIDDPNKDRPVRSQEHARLNQADRFLREEELEGKPELKKLAKGQRTREAEADEKYGDDVTNDYEEAGEQDYRVFKKGKKFAIFDADDLEQPVKKGLKEKQVAKALKELSGEEG